MCHNMEAARPPQTAESSRRSWDRLPSSGRVCSTNTAPGGRGRYSEVQVNAMRGSRSDGNVNATGQSFQTLR